MKKLEFDNEDVFFTSALKNSGKEELVDFIFERWEKYAKDSE